MRGGGGHWKGGAHIFEHLDFGRHALKLLIILALKFREDGIAVLTPNPPDRIVSTAAELPSPYSKPSARPLLVLSFGPNNPFVMLLLPSYLAHKRLTSDSASQA